MAEVVKKRPIVVCNNGQPRESGGQILRHGRPGSFCNNCIPVVRNTCRSAERNTLLHALRSWRSSFSWRSVSYVIIISCCIKWWFVLLFIIIFITPIWMTLLRRRIGVKKTNHIFESENSKFKFLFKATQVDSAWFDSIQLNSTSIATQKHSVYSTQLDSVSY